MTYDKMRKDYERMREADKNRIVDEWKAANGYNDLLAAWKLSSAANCPGSPVNYERNES
jgi:hypothetical protein